MKITGMSIQVRNPNRVNISIDGKYRFSLTIGQVADEGLKEGREVDEGMLDRLTSESVFGKLYQRTLEYVLIRPRSMQEVGDYLYRKTRTTPVRNRRTGEVSLREGVSQEVADRVMDRLQNKGYISDKKFAEFWIRHRFTKKGISQRRLRSELLSKGVAGGIIDEVLQVSERDESSELAKVIKKKKHRYDDEAKFIQYLARQGFRYDDIKDALREDELVEP